MVSQKKRDYVEIRCKIFKHRVDLLSLDELCMVGRVESRRGTVDFLATSTLSEEVSLKSIPEFPCEV